MKKVFQTKFGYPNGNCHAACLASIFELNIDDIPDFGKRSNWYDNFIKWCVEALDLYPIDIDINKSDIEPRGYYIVNGKSLNGDFRHSVVAKDGEIIHDPHPEGALKNTQTYTMFLKIIG